MTSRDLFNELSNIDEKLVEEAGSIERKEAKPVRKNYLKVIGPLVAAAACFVLVAGGVGVKNLITAKPDCGENSPGETERDTDNKYVYIDETVAATYVIYVKDFVYFEGNTYRQCLTDEEFEKGELIGEVGQNPEYDTSDYVGCPVYSIKGRKGTAKILVEKDGETRVFWLHEWGYEPDIDDYMRLDGITEASDIVSVELHWNFTRGEGYTGNALIEDSESIDAFYNILTGLVLDSEGYTKIVEEFAARDYAAWVESGGNQVYEDENGGRYTLAYEGTTAFDNFTHISIKTTDNEELSFSYYPKIGYVYQFKAPDELVSWLETHKN